MLHKDEKFMMGLLTGLAMLLLLITCFVIYQGYKLTQSTPVASPAVQHQVAVIQEMPACTEEGKQCSDGSWVVRGGENCEFAACLGKNVKKVFIEKDKNVNSVILIVNGERQVIATDAHEIIGDDVQSFTEYSDVYLSPRGNYIIYTSAGWEWGGMHVYDIKNKKHLENLGTERDVAFSRNEKYMYKCGYGGYGGGRIATIIDMENGEEIFDAFGDAIGSEKYERNNEYDQVHCWVGWSNDRERMEISLERFDMYSGLNKKITFDIKTGEISK